MLLSCARNLLTPTRCCACPCSRNTAQAVFNAASVDNTDSRASKVFLRAAGVGLQPPSMMGACLHGRSSTESIDDDLSKREASFSYDYIQACLMQASCPESLGQIHFWIFFIGVNITFFPMQGTEADDQFMVWFCRHTAQLIVVDVWQVALQGAKGKLWSR